MFLLQNIWRLSKKIITAVDLLTRPPASLTQDERYYQARMTAVSLLLWLMAFIAELLWGVISGHSFHIWQSLLILPFLTGLYILSRSRFYTWSATTSIVLLASLPHVFFYVAWMKPQTAATLVITPARFFILGHLIWLFLAVFQAVVLLPAGWDLLALLLIIHTPWWIPWKLDVPPEEVALLYGLLWVIGLPVWAMAAYQKHHWRRLLQLQQAHEEQRQFLNTVIDSIDASFYVIDATTYEIVLANQRARQLGVDQARFCYAVTHRRASPCSGDDHPCPLVHVRQQRKPYTVEHVHYTAQGEPYYVEVHGYPILDASGEVRFMIEYGLDVTQRKKAEHELRKLWRAAEHSAHGIIITDANGVIEYVNPAFTRMTGYTAEEVIGRTPAILRSGYHDADFYRDLWETIKAGKVWQGELVNRRKDGSLYYEEQTIAPVPDEEGRITHFIAVKQDITERKRLMRQLQEAKTQAERALVFKSTLLAGISHDLRTPLGAIMGYADMLRQGIFGPLNEEQKERLDAILSSAQYMRELITLLLLHAEVESNTLRIEWRKVPLPKLLATVRESLWVLAHKRGVGLETILEEDAPREVHTDPRLLRSVITNLVSNALKFTQSGKVTIRLSRVDERHWAIAVADTGVGMSEEERRRVFEPFYTRSRVKMSGVPGIGLGLYIVHSLVKRLGGRVDVWSEEGKGSIFTVIFPDIPLPATSPSSAKDKEPPSSRQEEVRS